MLIRCQGARVADHTAGTRRPGRDIRCHRRVDADRVRTGVIRTDDVDASGDNDILDDHDNDIHHDHDHDHDTDDDPRDRGTDRAGACAAATQTETEAQAETGTAARHRSGLIRLVAQARQASPPMSLHVSGVLRAPPLSEQRR